MVYMLNSVYMHSYINHKSQNVNMHAVYQKHTPPLKGT